jgi:hypothetical protein
MNFKILLFSIAIILSSLSAARDANTPSKLSSTVADDAKVYFVSPSNGALLRSPFPVKFGATNVTITSAGNNQPNSGHHHLLINLTEMPDLSMPLPANQHLIHFGKGQSEALVELPSGTHTLQLLLGNYIHVPHHRPLLSEKITITVK